MIPSRALPLLFLLVTLSACEGPELPPPEPPPPEPPPPCATSTLAPPIKLSITTGSTLDAEQREQAASELATRLSTELPRWHELAKKEPADCEDLAQVLTSQMAAWATDQPERCVAIAERCLPGSTSLTDGQSLLALYAGFCADRLHRLQAAHGYLRRAVASENERCPDHAGRVFAVAYFARTTEFEGEVDELLGAQLGWSSAQVTLATSAIDLLAGRQTAAAAGPEVEAFLLKNLREGSRTWQAIVFPIWLRSLSLGVEQADLAITNLVANKELFGLFPSQSSIAHALYSALFISSATNGTALADRVYREYAPWAKHCSFLPLEDNSHTYSEIGDLCRDGLLSADGRGALGAVVTSWRAGEKSAAEALAAALSLLDRQGEKADLLTFVGYLQQRLGKREEARALYLRAHKACPYYDRAHWGLSVLERAQRIEAYSDFSRRRAEVQTIADQLEPPALANQYFSLDGSVAAPERKLFLSAVGLWLPYLQVLASAKSSAHLKHGFQLLSEIPGLEYLRDKRVEYDKDYRLYDDLRGVGGQVVAADLDATTQSFFAADTNILFHEMAHQLHKAAPASFQACIQRLYEEAKARNNFATYYASRNELEYFAVSAECFLLPGDASPRYGKNQSWVKTADPKLFSVLSQIQQKADLAQIACP